MLSSVVAALPVPVIPVILVGIIDLQVQMPIFTKKKNVLKTM